MTESLSEVQLQLARELVDDVARVFPPNRHSSRHCDLRACWRTRRRRSGWDMSSAATHSALHNAKTGGLSDFSHGTPVACHHRVDSQQSHALNRCLGDKNPVEGVLMNGRQAVDGEGMFAGDG